MAEEASAPGNEPGRAQLANLSHRGTLSVHVVIHEDDDTRKEFVGRIVRVSNGRGRVMGVLQIKAE